MKTTYFHLLRIIVLALGLALVGTYPTAASADDFYKEKTIRFIVGYAPGGATWLKERERKERKEPYR
jgi:tripartite-type tricarboxylate transporter receptor subunit TctC